MTKTTYTIAFFEHTANIFLFSSSKPANKKGGETTVMLFTAYRNFSFAHGAHSGKMPSAVLIFIYHPLEAFAKTPKYILQRESEAAAVPHHRQGLAATVHFVFERAALSTTATGAIMMPMPMPVWVRVPVPVPMR